MLLKSESVRATSACVAVAFLTSVVSLGCRPVMQATGQTASLKKFEPGDQSKCSISKSQLRPLIVEWPSADRAALEAAMSQYGVAVKYSGCQMEVLPRCQVPGKYQYR